MRIGELSRQSQVSVATIKYYLREGLLPAGVASAANQADYTEEHLRRLRLIRALIGVGGLPVARAREVLAAVDAREVAPHHLLGMAQYAIAPPVDAAAEDPDRRRARAEVLELVRRHGWQVDPEAGGIDRVAEAVSALRALGQDDLLELLDTYAEAAAAVARRELAVVVARRDPAAMVEGVVIGTVLGEALLTGLRLLAEQDASARRLGAAPGADGGKPPG
ncbi:MerR family transcriptional regulator [Plantactinospora sp. KBS50]|uniref:MerR family transcriptional regulator n=1 Tax=Plantactinospora sp. KBS50 TaxID=2024580 RepID=UPI000BAAACCD|nr:MerR family transcriptional regulator [Plantactinospora sp. KBS50]ASW53898.1 hypothetical protein CIK06_06445 [Plantactinospora sp. KBS50]